MLQALSARSNAPECHIGQADRFKQIREQDFGTGLFKHKGSLGPQGISGKPSLPSYSLGASTRDQMYKVKSQGSIRYLLCTAGLHFRTTDCSSFDNNQYQAQNPEPSGSGITHWSSASNVCIHFTWLSVQIKGTAQVNELAPK